MHVITMLCSVAGMLDAVMINPDACPTPTGSSGQKDIAQGVTRSALGMPTIAYHHIYERSQLANGMKQASRPSTPTDRLRAPEQTR